ncbi:MAG: sulfatase [Verrucomicrobiota bacterium]
MCRFLHKLLILFTSLAASIGWTQERPNILFAFADDWGRHASIYAKLDGSGTINDAIRTPNFDALAAEGVLFTNAFVNAPSCTPCRSSILTGQHFWRTGTASILQGAVWDDSLQSWPILLEKNGYHIAYTWKVWGPGRPINAPFYPSKHAHVKGGRRYNNFSQSVTRLIAEDMSLAEAKEVMGEEIRRNFRGMLAARKDSQPFAYWFGPTNVHRKWTRGSGKALWKIDPDELEGKMPAFLPDVHEIRQDLADYLGEAMAFDMALGILVEELKRTGEYKNTLIAISGDHGPAGFPHGKCNLYDFGTRVSLAIKGPGVQGGRIVDDFVSLPDLAATFLQAGKVDPPEVMTSQSIWPTLESEESGLVDKKRTSVFLGRERHVAKARAGMLPYPQRAIRTKDYLFVINFKPDRFPLGDPYGLESGPEPSVEQLTMNTFVTLPDEDAGPTKAWIVSNRNDTAVKPFFENAYGKRPREELFDLNKDPDQMENLAADPAYASVVTALRKQLMTELAETEDPRLIDDGRFFETPPMAGPMPNKNHTKTKAQ